MNTHERGEFVGWVARPIEGCVDEDGFPLAVEFGEQVVSSSREYFFFTRGQVEVVPVPKPGDRVVVEMNTKGPFDANERGAKIIRRSEKDDGIS